MVAETLTRSPLVISPTHGYAGILKRQYFNYEIAANVEDGDIFELGYLPARSLVMGGFIATDDLDTGTEAMDVDLGWAAAGSSADTWTDPNSGIVYTNAAASASAAGLCNVGVMTGDGTAEVYQAGVNYRAIVLPIPLWFSTKTLIQLEANAAAGTGGTGTFGVYIDYVMT